MTGSRYTPDNYVAEFLALAKSAHIYFELINDRLTMRAVNPHWEMWHPIRHFLDEIGARAIEDYLRRGGMSPRWS
jgi:hypothetical protein